LSKLEGTKPTLIQTKQMKVGGLFTWQFYDDSPWILAAGGIKGELWVWDLENSESIVKNFQGEEAYEKLKKQEEEAGLEGRLSPEPANDEDNSDEDENMDEDQE
jgi:hypothetical protein